MFNNLEATLDWLYKIIWISIIFYLIFSGGIGFIIRIITSPLKIGFSNADTKNLDSKLLELQLLRLYHGINIENEKDKKMVSLAIKKNALTPKDFRFLYFAPKIGLRKHGKPEIFIFSITSILIFIALFQIATTTKEFRYDYATFTKATDKVLISEIYVYSPPANKYFNKSECKELELSLEPSIRSACRYLTNSDPDMRRELKNAIEKNNSSLTALISTLLTIFIAGCYFNIVYIKFVSTNNKFIEFKSNEINKQTPGVH